jgi:glutathione S-transferase
MYDQTTKSALVQAAMAATMEAGQALEGQIDASFEQLTHGIRAGSPEPAASAEIVLDDSARQEARDRVAAMLDALAGHARGHGHGHGESPA